MKILIVGYFTQVSKERIYKSFPDDWQIDIVEPGRENEFIGGCQVLIPEHIKVDEMLLKDARELRLVQTGAGYDNVDIEACTRCGVWVANAAGVNAVAVAEHTAALLLAYYKNIAYLDRFMKERQDEKQLFYEGGELAGKTIGIVGLGAIGRKVASYGHIFGMKVLGYDTNPDIPCEGYIQKVDFKELVRSSDVISLHIFLNEQTTGLFCKTVFEQMKDDALFINTSRGKIVKEADLIEALKSGVIGGACLDVYEEEPVSLDNELRNLRQVILTPHTAGMPDGLKFHHARYQFFLDNINRVAVGKEPKHHLNNVEGE